MANEDVATKSPESDAIDKSNDKSTPEDTAQEGASMGVSTAAQTQKLKNTRSLD